MRTAAACLLLAGLSVSAADPSPADIAIAKAIADLKQAKATARTPADRTKINRAIQSLASLVAVEPQPRNDLVSAFVDGPQKFAGETLTFKVSFFNPSNPDDLRRRQQRDGFALFEAYDSRNRAKLLFQVELPKEVEVPSAKRDEEVIITFECKEGNPGSGNVAKAVRRP